MSWIGLVTIGDMRSMPTSSVEKLAGNRDTISSRRCDSQWLGTSKTHGG